MGEAVQRVLEPAVAQDRGVQSLCEVTELGQPGAQVGQDAVELCACVLRELVVRGEAELQLQRDRDESLLGAIVKVALDLAPCAVAGLEDASARRADLGQLRLEDRALAHRLLGGSADGDVEDRSVEPAPAVADLLGLTAFEDPAHAAVAPPNPILELEG